MPYYGVTITANTRTNNLLKDKAAVQSIIDVFKARKDIQEISDLCWELKSYGHNNLHCHCLLVAKRPPYMKLKVFKDVIKANGLNVYVGKSLRSSLDVNRWVEYCHKSDHRNLHDDYEESIPIIKHRILWSQ